MNSTETAAILPETCGERIDAAVLLHAIEATGAILVRELVSPADVQALSAAFQRALAARDANTPGDWFTPFDDGTQALAVKRAWARSVDCALMADSPAMLVTVLDVYRRSGIIDLVTSYLGETPVLSSQKSTLRRALSGKAYTDNWHQDGAFLGADIKVLNVWLALTECGKRAPSVEICLRRQTDVVPTGGEGAIFDWSVSPQQAAKASPCSAIPVCAPGDGLLFDHLCLHRTSIDPAYCEERRALETWFFAPSSYPHDFDPRPIRV